MCVLEAAKVRSALLVFFLYNRTMSSPLKNRGGKMFCGRSEYFMPLLVVVVITSCVWVCAGKAGLQLRKVVHDTQHLNFTAESRIYPEAPDLLWVTTRKSGLSVWNISEPLTPTLVATWAEHADVEGQDRMGDLLVVVDEGNNGLLTFDVSGSNGTVLRFLAYLELQPRMPLPLGGALHTKLYRTFGRTFAIVSMGWQQGSDVVAVEVTDPLAPKQVVRLSTDVNCMEGILIVHDFAFIGGFCSTQFISVYLRGLASPSPSMRIQDSQVNPAYNEMVGVAGSKAIYHASFTLEGGLLVFSLEEALHGRIHEIGRLLSPALFNANRVYLHEAKGFVVLPLEHQADYNSHGGFALVDVRNVTAPILLDVVQEPAAKVYCGNIHSSGEFAYSFGAESSTMNIYQVSLS